VLFHGISAALAVWTYWCSIVLEAAPYLLVGAFAAHAAQRCAVKHPSMPALFALLLPGCDCSLNSFAGAMARVPRGLAAFALVWAALCSPVALLATFSVLGPRMLGVRLGAGLLAGALTALLWTALEGMRTHNDPHHCGGPALETQPATPKRASPTGMPLDMYAAVPAYFSRGLIGLAPAAFMAAIVVALFPRALAHHASAGMGMLAGALLSPCSTADATLARVFFVAPGAQAAFIIAAQSLDIRQFILLRSHFGVARCALALGAAATVCILAAHLA